MWTHISPVHEFTIQNKMSDFYVIKYDGEPFTPAQYNQLHQTCKNFIEQGLKQHQNKKVVVVTHHVPTLFHYPEKFKGDELNEAFAVELFDVIENMKPDYWIFGHHHTNIPDFKVGNTMLFTNQLGYVQFNEQVTFKHNKIFTI